MGTSALVIVVVALVVLNLVDNLKNPPLWIDPIIAAALLAFARLDGLTWSQLGLGRSSLLPGLLWGSAAIGAVALVYVVGVALPATRSAFRDDRYHVPLRGALRSAFVVIPIGTILVEETAFRSVLWALLRQHVTQLQTLVVTSALFGLWHILPARHFRGRGEAGKAVPPVLILGTVAFTALGGVVAGILRIVSDSVLASAGMHWATNALGVLFGVVAWRLAPAPAPT
jgi:membrane protease YdiL (CAAX protease family)